MDVPMDDHVELPSSSRGSRATSPGGIWREVKDTKVIEVAASPNMNGDMELEDGDAAVDKARRPARYRPRTFPYRRYLPYRHVDNQYQNLQVCIKNLYVAVSAGDFAPGATHWTREIRGWMSLKFDLPRDDRIRLIRLYYDLALAPGMDSTASERFGSMFMNLTKRKHYLKPGEDLTLDWRPLWKEIKTLVLPADTNSLTFSSGSPNRRSTKTLLKLCSFAQVYFDPEEAPLIFEEILPFFSTSNPDTGFAVIVILNLLIPSYPAPAESKWHPQHYLPTIHHLWSLMNRSKVVDLAILDLFSRIARDGLGAEQVPMGPYGVFTNEQASMVFTAILRLCEIPVSQVSSPYSHTVDAYAGLAILLEKDQRKYPASHSIARWIVMSLSPEGVDTKDSILAKLEGLIQATETFFHPSNSGGWTRTLSQIVFYLADFFVMRWNREASGEMATPTSRRLNDAIKRRFVLCLRDVTFMGIFSKSGTAMSYALSALQNLAFLEPTLILPGALQRIYPSLRGSVEVHRTTSSIRALRELARVIVRTKGFRCHITALLGLALPGIDANDLDKTMHTLTFFQAVFYEVPMWTLNPVKADLDDDDETPAVDGTLAAEWVTGQIERLDAERVDMEIDYEKELSDADEAAIVISSTAEFGTFVISLLERVFNLLRNLPDAARLRTSSSEEHVANTLPAALGPMFSTMSPELFDLALNKVADFASKHVVHQARDAMSFLCSCLCKVDAKKSLSVLIPILCRSIRTEIEETGAGSSRTAGSEVLPRDKALVWYIGLLSMSLVHAGSAVVDFADELLDIVVFLRERCKGIPSSHASNLIHHILLTLTTTYTVDTCLYEDSEIVAGVTPALWAHIQDPYKLSIKWHYSDQREIDLAIKIFATFAERELKHLTDLIGPTPPVRRDGSGKDWSDEVSRSLIVLRLITAGTSSLFDTRIQDPKLSAEQQAAIEDTDSGDDIGLGELTDADYGATEDEDVRPSFQYPAGTHLSRGSDEYQKVHELRHAIGEMLHNVHKYLTEKQQDDVIAFNALYTTYRSWFTDVGVERSAHTLERVTRLFVADSGPFKMSGTRKEFPRPLLIRRANVYHLQRQKHNASPRPCTDLDATLLKDLVQSSVSHYTDIRKTAQTAIEASMKVIIGARPILIPPFIEHFQAAVKTSDFPRIKGAMYSLLFGALLKPISRDWRYTPAVIKAYVDVLDVDKTSIVKLSTAAAIQIMDMTRPGSRMAILDKSVVDAIKPYFGVDEDKVTSKIDRRKALIQKRRDFVLQRRQETGSDLAGISTSSHWKKESRTATVTIGLGLRFEEIASDKMIDLTVKRAVDSHPQLRTIYGSALVGLFTYIDMRAIADHKYENFLLEKRTIPSFVKMEPDRHNPNFASEFLASFSKPETELYIDQDHPGWLVWGKYIPAFKASQRSMPDYDDVEQHARKRIGLSLTRDWFAQIFGYMKQEPRDTSADRFRMTNVICLTNALGVVFDGFADTSFEDIKELTKETFGDGSDKHQHRATAEILCALLSCGMLVETNLRTEIWSFVFPIVRSILEDGMTPDNQGYWSTFIDVLLQNRDPRRAWPLVEWLSSFRLDRTSNAAFKESSKITSLMHSIADIGWHYQLGKPIWDDFVANLDHPYKGVREVMGITLATMNRAEYYESYPDVTTLIESQKAASTLGTRPYELTPEFKKVIEGIFDQIEQWRKERPPGQQTASAYTSASKTMMLWLESTFSSFECTKLIPFFPNTLLDALLHMMDIKEDPELQGIAYSAFRQLGNIPFRAGEETDFVEALMRIGRTATSWHQRLRSMINIQAVYFRHLFLMPQARQEALFDCISAMLEDTQLEVRVGAGATLSGMIRCSPLQLRQQVLDKLILQFTDKLRRHPLRRREQPGTPTPEQNRTLVVRHAAVLGLGALIQAFPYASPPFPWMPDVLTTLANKAAGDPGVVGKSAKGIVSDFKKTRQDTWLLDTKVCCIFLFLSSHLCLLVHGLTMVGAVFPAGAVGGSRGCAVEELLCVIGETASAQLHGERHCTGSIEWEHHVYTRLTSVRLA
ncbi:hypothetical protein FH972_021259 [Carpinus fangiana]|uniref:Proteasome activator subunit 4 n=1 Tax=Carpinus fangiana TaxID=176857 RepID=A0A5N6KP08_9ROSI|nr:hypothetical protein FH972_021259 [Carpinus fangiana]